VYLLVFARPCPMKIIHEETEPFGPSEGLESPLDLDMGMI
jgi:hypothetical protein